MKINFLNQDIKWKESLQSGFETQRLRVQALDKNDLTRIPEISGDNEIFTFVSGINDGDAAVIWVKSVYQKRNYLFFSIKAKVFKPFAGNALIGVLMLNRQSDGQIEIGGWLGTESQQKGFGVEIIKGLVGLVQKNGANLQLYAEVQEENIAAIQMLEETGVKQIINPCRKKNDKD